jgi:hypothetical protein
MPGGRPAAGLPALAEWLPLVGSPFQVRLDAWRTATFTLVEAVGHTPRGHRGRAVSGEAFSLIFAAPDDVALPGAIHTVRQRAIGTVRLFVSPVGTGANGRRYEAVVNGHALAG